MAWWQSESYPHKKGERARDSQWMISGKWRRARDEEPTLQITRPVDISADLRPVYSIREGRREGYVPTRTCHLQSLHQSKPPTEDIHTSKIVLLAHTLAHV